MMNAAEETEAETQRLLEREARHARMRVFAAEAMADPGFVADLRETVHAFRHVDKENWSCWEDSD